MGTLKRVIISNLVCSNSVSALGSIISGIPGHYIEDVKISNVQMLHQGGGTKEDARTSRPNTRTSIPSPTCSLRRRGPGATAAVRTDDFVPEGQGRGAAGAGRGAAGAGRARPGSRAAGGAA